MLLGVCFYFLNLWRCLCFVLFLIILSFLSYFLFFFFNGRIYCNIFIDYIGVVVGVLGVVVRLVVSIFEVVSKIG